MVDRMTIGDRIEFLLQKYSGIAMGLNIARDGVNSREEEKIIEARLCDIRMIIADWRELKAEYDRIFLDDLK